MVSDAILSKQRVLIESILTDLQKDFVAKADLNTFLQSFGLHTKNKSEDKVVYHNATTACTRRLDDLEKLARSGSVTTPTPRSIYDPFQKTLSLSQGNRSSASNLNNRLDALEGMIRLLKGLNAGEQVVHFGGLGFSSR